MFTSESSLCVPAKPATFPQAPDTCTPLPPLHWSVVHGQASFSVKVPSQVPSAQLHSQHSPLPFISTQLCGEITLNSLWVLSWSLGRWVFLVTA